MTKSLTALMGLLLLVCSPVHLQAQEDMPPSQAMLPPTTAAWVSVPNAEAMKQAIEETQFGAMMNDPAVRPFVEDLAKQLRGYLDEQNIRFGLKVEDLEEVHSGEICLAGVLKPVAEGAEAEASDHAIVLLVDVANSNDKTDVLLKRVGEKLRGEGATEESIEINGVEASKWSFKAPQGLGKRRYAFHAVTDGWLIACDSESTFRDVIARVKKVNEDAPNLAETETFRAIAEGSKFQSEQYDTHIRWFIEPFGYVQLAQAIADTHQSADESIRNDWAKKFQEEGFSAIKGLGGQVCIATGQHEAVHRSMIYAPPVLEGDDRYERAAALLDFRNPNSSQLNPPAWVPKDSAGFLTFTWDLQKALNRVGSIIDKTTGTDGSFERALESLATDHKGPRVDLRKLVTHLNNRITVSSITELPIDGESERIVLGIKITNDVEYVDESIFRLFRSDAEVTEHNGVRVLIVDTADEAVPELEIDLDDEFGDPLAEEESDDEGDEEFQEPKPLFEKRVFAVKGGFLFLSNNVEQIHSVLDTITDVPGNELAQASDYVRINKALQSLAGGEAPSFRHFGRMDQSLRTNYEMVRTGQMASAKTLLAQLLNRAYEADENYDEETPRKQQIDGSKLPEDYEGQVAKYFGPTGTVVHTIDNGWVITGCLLRKDVENTSTHTAKEELAIENK